jgi:hypothetical protein
MSTLQPRYSKEEFARRGAEIYERQVRSQVEEGNQGKIVAIDVETGAFEVADDLLTASDRLLVRYPDAQTWFVRIGHRAVHRFGSLGLTWRGQAQAVLGDGSLHQFNVYAATVIWDGQARFVEIDAADTTPLVGVGLLYRHDLRVRMVEGGSVSIEALPHH